MPRKVLKMIVLKMIAIDIHQQVAAIFTCDIWHQDTSSNSLTPMQSEQIHFPIRSAYLTSGFSLWQMSHFKGGPNKLAKDIRTHLPS